MGSRQRSPGAPDADHEDPGDVTDPDGPAAEGPISDPRDLGPAIKRALAVVARGEPAFLDTVTQPR